MPADVLRLFVFARHAESAANAANALNSNPSQPVALTVQGRTQARTLGAQLANLHIDLAVGTRLLRTQQTIDIAMDDRQVPTLIEPGFDEIHAGDLEGAPIEATGPGGTITPWATACPMARAPRTPCGATRARCGASWPGKKRSRSSSSTSSHCDISRRPQPTCRRSTARPSRTQFRISSTNPPSGALRPA